MDSTYQDPSVASPARYRAVSAWAVLSVICGVATVTMFFPFKWFALPLPLAALYFGWEALSQVKRLPEEYTGRQLAQVGMGLAAGLGILLSGYLLFFRSEVPHDCQVLQWSDLEPDPKIENVSKAAVELSQKKTKIYVRGYMLPGRRQTGLTGFSICRTSDQCRFAQRSNRPIDLIHIELTGDLTIDYTTHQIGVGGIFQVDENSPYGTPYSIQATYLYP